MPPNNNRANHNELRGSIHAALQSFESKPLHDAAISLLNTLGYSSDKTIEIPDSDPQAFLELLAEHNPDIEIKDPVKKSFLRAYTKKIHIHVITKNIGFKLNFVKG